MIFDGILLDCVVNFFDYCEEIGVGGILILLGYVYEWVFS